MPEIKSVKDLKRLKEEVLEKRKSKMSSGTVQVSVMLGTCGIAAGARETLAAISQEIEASGQSGIEINQTGCIGLCEFEPLVQVAAGTNPPVMYGQVTPAMAVRIINEHVLQGNVVHDYVVHAPYFVPRR